MVCQLYGSMRCRFHPAKSKTGLSTMEQRLYTENT